MARLLTLLAVVVTAALIPGAPAQPGPGFVVVAEYPHDDQAFTQGLAFAGKGFFEGTGLNGRSSIRKVRLVDGTVRRIRDLPERFFGEGVTILDGRLYQLTWQNGKAFVYDLRTFKRKARFSYEGEGWGLTDNGSKLIMSDGSEVIEWRDPKTFEVLRSISVSDEGEAVTRLNELEWIDGEIWANVWPTDLIVRIDPSDGEVLSWIDLTTLADRERAEGNPDATNGIAYRPKGDRLFVTGKQWAHVYEIDLL